ncbi:MAG: lamin tail domain-containing protein, partial [Bacteroidales bacterium]|nr:lamin tail domain-containing protein [Bacteroidales bacterium]
SGTGPRGIAIRSSVDNYTTNLDQEYAITDNTSTQNFTFTFSQDASIVGVTYRFYMWAESTGGSGGIGDGTGNDLIVYGTTSAVGGNQIPSISNITQTPSSGINSSTTVSVSADVTDSDGTIAGVELHWGTSSGILPNNINMSLASGDTYTTVTNIPAQVGGTTVYYEVYAIDDDADETTSPEQSYYVISDEPTNHPTSFMADVAIPAYSTIEVVWDDAIGAVLPTGYVVKASNVSYGAIVAPVDGTPETPGTLVKVVAAGVEYASFTDLDDNTTYYFKIWPFTNSDATIDYKTGGSVPQDEATTSVAPLATKVFISEYVEGSSNNKAVEIFNADNFALDLTKLTIRLYSNGSPTPGNTWTGTSGTLPPGQSIVIYNSSADPEIQAVGFESSAVTYFNGDDALDVVYDSQVTDVFGTIGTDPGASWPVAGVDGATADHTLIRKLTITQGNTDWASSAGTDAANSEWVVKDKDYFGNLSFVGTVLQGVSTNWTDVANWDMGLPDEFTNAIINGSVTVNDIGECNDLTILPLAAVTVGAGQGLIVYGDLLIKSDATGTGSFIGAAADYTITGTQTIQRHVTGGPIGAGKFKYHLLSIPLAANIQAGDVFTGTYLWHFVPNKPDIDSWTGISSLTENLDYRKGFLSYVETAENTFSFTGNMNNGSFSTAAETIPVGKFKLIPNPYPSAIDWDLVDKTDIENAVYFYNSETGNYVSYLDGDLPAAQKYIPVGQAVFVKAKNANPTITFDNSVRVHSGQLFYKDANQAYKDVLKIAVSANQSADATFIRFRELADNNYNGFDDASKLRGFAGAPQLYTQSADDKALSINTLATSQETVIVPLAYELEVTGEAVFSFEYLETFEPTVTVFLEDLLLDKMIVLREQNTYSFEHEAGNDPLRFKLHFMGVTNVNEIASSAKNF